MKKYGFGKLFDVRSWRVANITPAMVLALVVAAFPTSFALAGGRAVAEVQAETLIEEITGLPVSVVNHGGGSATVIDGSSRFEYSGIVRHRDGSVSAQVQELVAGRLVANHVLQRGLVISPNENKIDFNVESTALGGRFSETSGSITRMSGGDALLQVEKNDGVEASTMTLSLPSATSKSVASLANMITIVPVGMSAKAIATASVVGCAVAIIVIVGLVVIGCLVFGWFGC